MVICKNKKIFALVFARGGSKGLPGKNIKELNGKPLLAYSIELAKKIPNVCHVFVSTDDEKIAKVALQYGACVIDRPAELASDTASEWDAWQHAVQYLKKHYDMHDNDEFLSLPCTSPLREFQDIIELIRVFENQKPDLALCITDANRSPYFNMVKLNQAHCLELVCDAGSFVRRQDVPKTYDVTTVGYITTAKFIECGTGVLSGNTTGAIVPRENAVDIDTEFDFNFANFLISQRKVNNENF
ncbi:acylneuraminate cytidylyltransferase family protein [Pseudoalteromonas xiamenensis]|uniref:acylneuraminate cytidylyltransferase family protein n=1 Tax=Pseudoalteromonas xiamenensis TaxID=882626 RepID=UPI0027E489C8|nr:acylneuraminate cytidylyltransferase family protein [Pseudoalteromonas xiamenensis]WMN59386.1 acylneuraminate cytidylyltransferase family protein [Pseudoalteromonas xiamenensis]